MRVALDGRFCVGEHRGMGRFARNLIAPIESQSVVFGTRGQTDSELDVIDSGPSFYPYWEQIHLPYMCKKHNIDVLVCPYNTAPIKQMNDVKVILVLHDIIFMKSFLELPPSSSTYQILGRIYRKAVVPKVIKTVDHIITVSRYSKKEICRKFKASKNSISVIPNTISPEWFKESEAKLKYKRPYIFTLSAGAPSKNLRRGIQAFSRLHSEYSEVDCDLLVAGVSEEKHTYFERIAKEEGVGQRVHFFPYISDEKLRRVYRSASVFFLPSLYEGFGIPIIEAMACGVPVACSSRSSLTEIAGESAIFFDPLSQAEMAKSLNKLLTDVTKRQQLSRSGKKRAMKYHPDVVNEEINEFWDKVGL